VLTRASLAVVLALAMPALAETVRRPARTVERSGVTVEFPEVTYTSPDLDGEPVAVVCARVASAALGVMVDPKRDLLAETDHRVVLDDPRDDTYVLKLYRPDTYGAERIARMMQRDLGVQALLQDRGLRVAALDETPDLVSRGILRQPRVAGRGLDKVYPQGYRPGTDPAIDRMLAVVAEIDAPLRGIVSLQTGLVFSNTVDCYHDRLLGVDLGHCYGNIFLDTSNRPIFVDW
jgi:hypothetical protein